jgi:hypothetical protein
MRRALGVAAVLAATAWLAATDAKAGPDADIVVPTAKEVEDYVSNVLSANKESFKVGPVAVDVVVIPYYADYLIAKELGEKDLREGNGKFVRDKVRSLVKKNVKIKGKAAARVRVVHEKASGDDLVCFEGSLENLVKVSTAMGKARTIIAATDGLPTAHEYTLFNVQRCNLFEGNVTPVMRFDYALIGKSASQLDIVIGNEINERAKRIEVKLGSVIHFTGGGIKGNQIDFRNGAVGTREESGKASFELPLVSPKMPESLVRLMDG